MKNMAHKIPLSTDIPPAPPQEAEPPQELSNFQIDGEAAETFIAEKAHWRAHQIPATEEVHGPG